MDMFFDRERGEYYCLRCQFTGSEEKVLEMNELARFRYGAMHERLTVFADDAP